MDGAPGVGKTTITQNLCTKWAEGEMLQEFHLVILIQLRKYKLNEQSSIAELFPSESVRDEVVQLVCKDSDNLSKHILFIFDGYDEAHKSCKSDTSLLSRVITEEVLGKCSVLVTSRPYASEYIKTLPCINRRIEVLGFSSQKQIEECITSDLSDPDAASRLVKILKGRLDIVSLCYIPLNCRIVFYVYEKNDFKLPSTLTELYIKFIINTVKHHILRNKTDWEEKAKLQKVKTLSDLPNPFNTQINSLYKMAYSGIQSGTYFFEEEELQLMDSLSLGLLTAHFCITDKSTEQFFQFLHLTVQEFLAANYIATFHKDQLLEFFRKHIDDTKFRMTLLFTAGLTKLNFVPSGKSLLNFDNKLSTQSSKMGEVNKEIQIIQNHCYESEQVTEETNKQLFILLAHLVYESEEHSNADLIPIQFNKLDLSGESLSPFEELVISHFLSSTTKDFEWEKINLVNCNLSFAAIKEHKLNKERSSIGMTKSLQIGPLVDDVKCVFPILTQGLKEVCFHYANFNHNTFSALCKTMAIRSNLIQVAIISEDSRSSTELPTNSIQNPPSTHFPSSSTELLIDHDTSVPLPNHEFVFDSSTFSVKISRQVVFISSNLANIMCSSSFIDALNFLSDKESQFILCENQAQIFTRCKACQFQGLKAVGVLCTKLRTNQTISWVNISNCNLDPESIRMIVLAISNNLSSGLRELNIDGNDVGDLNQVISLTVKGISLKVCGFHFRREEKGLIVTNFKSSHKEVNTLLRILRVPEYFTAILLEIDFHINDWLCIQTIFVAYFLRQNQSLRHVELTPIYHVLYLELSCKDKVILAQAIRTHKSLEYLSFPHFTIGKNYISISGGTDCKTKLCTFKCFGHIARLLNRFNSDNRYSGLAECFSEL